LLCFSGWKLNILESVAATLAIGLSVDFTLHYGVAYSAAALASRSHQNHVQGDAVTQAVTQMCGPVTMAALTTLLPGGISFFVESRLNLIHLKLPMALGRSMEQHA
jgi:predicted RND superfamily exporter protein